MSESSSIPGKLIRFPNRETVSLVVVVCKVGSWLKGDGKIFKNVGNHDFLWLLFWLVVESRVRCCIS